jgi:hypothetical protein
VLASPGSLRRQAETEARRKAPYSLMRRARSCTRSSSRDVGMGVMGGGLPTACSKGLPSQPSLQACR